MKITYLLKKKGKGKPNPIYVALYENDQTALISTGQKCLASEWGNERPKDQSSDLYHDIEAVKASILDIQRLMKAHKQEVNPFALQREYKRTLDEKKQEKQVKIKTDKVNRSNVMTLIDKWKSTGLDNYNPSTRKVVKASIHHLEKFLEATGRKKLELKELDKDLLAEYARYLQVKKGLLDSTHGKVMKHTRWFLKYIGLSEGFIKEIKIRTVAPTERNIIHLTSEELSKLEAVDVSFDKEWQRAKDMYLLGCYTGLRISDLKRIHRHRIIDGAINLTLTKNRTSVSIPVLRQTREILERYDMASPKISEQQVNNGIKKVCEKAEIDSIVCYKSVKEGQLIEKNIKKYNLITTHTAGKTFISLAGERWNLLPAEIAAIVGKDVKTILGYYLKPDAESAKTKMIEADKRVQMKIA